jgi:tetratricopeptide (TPR) repeat protein
MFSRWFTFLLLPLALWGTTPPTAPGTETLLAQAAGAEARLDTRRALELYLAADAARPDDAFILQKIARQYSDLVEEQPTPDARKSYAQTALDFSLRAVALEPENPVNVLSLAICHGRLAAYSDTRTKVKYSRLIKAEAERALALDPDYAWAHHVLGRWHYEVAALGRTARFLVRLFYGGLPDASAAEAVRHLQRAVELEPHVLAHQLELGFAYRAAGDATAARRQWERGLAMPTREKHDAIALARARAALAAM